MIDLGTPKSGTLAAGGVALFEIDPTADSRLIAQVHTADGDARLSLLDAQGNVVLQSDGQSPSDPNPSIDVHVSAGVQYLELDDLGAGGAFTLTTSAVASNGPTQPVPVGTAPSAMVTGDWSDDGITGLAVANESAGTVSVLLGTGDGTFQDQVTYPVGTGPTAIVAADFDGRYRPDGSPILDLAVTNSNDNTVSVLLGNGDGTFQPQVAYVVGVDPTAIVAADFDGRYRPDGSPILDLAVTNRGGNTVSVLLGDGDGTFKSSGSTIGSGFVTPTGVAVNAAGDVYVADTGNNAIKEVLPSGTILTIGSGFDFPEGVAVDASGDVFVADTSANAVKEVLPSGTILTIGSGFSNPVALAVDASGDVFVADAGNSAVKEVLPNGSILSIGSGFSIPVGVAVDASGDVFVADEGNNAVKEVLPSGTILTIGSGFSNPEGVAVNAAGDVFVADTGNNAVKEVLPGNNMITKSAGAFRPTDVTVDAAGDVFVAANGNDAVREIPAGARADTIPVGNDPDAILAGEFTGDGRIDLAVANQGVFDYSTTYPALLPGTSSVSVLLGNGDGTFQSQVTYAVGADPTALVAGDFSGNGRTDLAVANEGTLDANGFPDPDTTSVSVLLGNGDGTFQKQVTYAVGTEASALVTGDFSDNGRTDLAVASVNDDTVSVLLGNGDGTFQNPVSYAVGGGPAALVAADFTGEGQADLAVANSAASTVSVFLGTGRGTFQDPVTNAVGGAPLGMVAADFNGDGRFDLAVANEAADTVSVLLGNGDGTFENQATYQVGRFPTAIVAGDFNGDGRIDLAVVNADDDTVSVLLGNGDGTFQNQVIYQVGMSPDGLVAGDFTGNGITDLAVANEGPLFDGGNPLANSVSVLLGNGDGTFQPQITYPVGTEPAAIVAADFTGSGVIDLAVANIADDTVSVLLGNGKGTFQKQVAYGVGGSSYAVVAGDFDGRTRPDGTPILDLALANPIDNTVSVLLGNGDGTFKSSVPSIGSGFNNPTGLAVDASGDLFVADAGNNAVKEVLKNGSVLTIGSGFNDPNGVAVDASGDVFVADSGDSAVKEVLPNGTILTKGAGFNHPYAVAVDAYGDIFVADTGNDELKVVLPDGTILTVASFNSPLTGIAVNAAGDVFVADYNGVAEVLSSGTVLTIGSGFSYPATVAVNASGDVFVADYRNNALKEVLPNGSILTIDSNLSEITGVAVDASGDVFVTAYGNDSVREIIPNEPSETIRVGNSPGALVAGDFFGDGRTDLAVVNNGDDTISVLVPSSDGTFQIQATYPVGANPVEVVAADFNGDGRTDLAVANESDNTVSVLLGNGGSFQAPAGSAATLYGTPVVADFNGDGASDVAVVDSAGNILVRLGRPGQPGVYNSPITINPGAPSRAIAWVPTTNQGPVLASADAHDDSVTLYAWRGGQFVALGSLATGKLPTQIVAADLNGDGLTDLVVRNALDGTLSVYFGAPFNRSNLEGPIAAGFFPPTFLAPVTLSVGLGASDVQTIDTAGNGLLDLVVTNSVTGQLSIIRNLGNGTFAPPEPYRAGTGLSNIDTSSGSPQITSLDDPVGVAGGPIAPGGPIDLVTANPGSSSLDVLAGLGGGRFVNPVSLPTTNSAQMVLVADLTGDGYADLIVLTANSVDVYLSNHSGGFLPPVSYAAGESPSGVSLADVNGDGHLDLLVGDPLGDVLLLVGKGDGTFQPFQNTDQNIALAVANIAASGQKDVAFADQGLDRVALQEGSSGTTIVSDSSQGLLAPGAVELADLNGDGIPDLIVANSGSNNVLVYPGLGNGQFGPALNDGQGFFTGTDPVGITVADVGNGRQDLVIADKGSNDVAILLNGPTAGGGFTFVQGPRLKTGDGPVATAVGTDPATGEPYLMVSNSGSNSVWMEPGVGGGFFNDQNPTIYPVGTNPGALFIGNFNGTAGLATVNAGSNDVTLVSNFLSDTPVTESFSSGGLDPVAGFMTASGSGFDSLVIANNESGSFALLEGGASGLSMSSSTSETGLPSPTSLAFSGFSGGELEFYASTAGVEAASLLALSLSGTTATPEVQPAAVAGVASLVSLNENSLALVATFLTVTIESTSIDLAAATEESASVAAFLPGPSVSAGQSGPRALSTSGGDTTGALTEDPTETARPETPRSITGWERLLLELDEALEQIRKEMHDRFFNGGADGKNSSAISETLDSLVRSALDGRANATDHAAFAQAGSVPGESNGWSRSNRHNASRPRSDEWVPTGAEADAAHFEPASATTTTTTIPIRPRPHAKQLSERPPHWRTRLALSLIALPSLIGFDSRAWRKRTGRRGRRRPQLAPDCPIARQRPLVSTPDDWGPAVRNF